MLICDKCGAQIPEGAKFCPQCADPVTEADVVAKPPTERTRLVCPKCESQGVYDIVASRSAHRLKCPKCRRVFTTRIVQIRAKRSRGYKEQGKRHFSVRVIEPSGAERLIEFANASYQDFELRARDLAAFSYRGNELKIVQNLTVTRYMKVSKPSCFLATYLHGPTSREVAILRLFRDNVLLGSVLFSPLVALYYQLSPVVVRWLGDNRVFRKASLVATKPIIDAAEWYLCTRQE